MVTIIYIIQDNNLSCNFENESTVCVEALSMWGGICTAAVLSYVDRISPSRLPASSFLPVGL